VLSLLKEVRPDRIVHLAARSSVADSLRDPWGTFAVNAGGTVSLLEAAAAAAPEARILIVGSAEAYGEVREDELPLTEDRPLMPLTPYGISKAAAEQVALFYGRTRGLDVVVARAFNHTGPGQEPTFVCSDFARQIARIEAGRGAAVMRVGDLTARRDFADVRDVVRAYGLILERGNPGEIYNVCSGKARSIGEILDILRGFADTSIAVEADPARGRSEDVPTLVGSFAKLETAAGWRPEIPLERTLKDLLDYWRGIVEKDRRR
jgi:GDP-4-dehydro-6-deoxy-D-mannose reductase